jgi:L-threonylcarbamoyladenylate synthase
MGDEYRPRRAFVLFRAAEDRVVTTILPPNEVSLALAAETLLRGDLVAIPTETVYGLAGSAVDERAVAAIFAAKDRPTFDPLIVHVATPDGWAAWDAPRRFARAAEEGIFDPETLGPRARERAARLMGAFWPGPLTLVLPRTPRIPLLVTSGLDTVAIRMPRHPLTQALLSLAAIPLAAPSANRFGRISPTSAADVLAELRGRIPLILDGGPSEVGLESTIVEIANDGELTLLRPGGVPAARIAEVAGKAPTLAAHRPGDRMRAPGTLDTHYAPSKPLVVLPGPVPLLDALPGGVRERIDASRGPLGLLLFSGDARSAVDRLEGWTGRSVRVETLSPTGNLEEAARRFFGALRALDDSRATVLLAEPSPTEEGLGHALADRLRRASAG